MTTTREHIQLYWKFRDKAEKIVLPFLLVSDFVRKDAKLSEFSNFSYKLFPYMLTVIVIDMVMSSVAIYSCGYRKHRKVNS